MGCHGGQTYRLRLFRFPKDKMALVIFCGPQASTANRHAA